MLVLQHRVGGRNDREDRREIRAGGETVELVAQGRYVGQEVEAVASVGRRSGLNGLEGDGAALRVEQHEVILHRTAHLDLHVQASIPAVRVEDNDGEHAIFLRDVDLPGEGL